MPIIKLEAPLGKRITNDLPKTACQKCGKGGNLSACHNGELWLITGTGCQPPNSTGTEDLSCRLLPPPGDDTRRGVRRRSRPRRRANKDH